MNNIRHSLIIIKILAFEVDLSITDFWLNESMIDRYDIFTGMNNRIIYNKFV